MANQEHRGNEEAMVKKDYPDNLVPEWVHFFSGNFFLVNGGCIVFKAKIFIEISVRRNNITLLGYVKCVLCINVSMKLLITA